MLVLVLERTIEYFGCFLYTPVNFSVTIHKKSEMIILDFNLICLFQPFLANSITYMKYIHVGIFPDCFWLLDLIVASTMSTSVPNHPWTKPDGKSQFSINNLSKRM